MSPRQRGVTVVLGLLLLGRIVDRLDLPFEYGTITPLVDSRVTPGSDSTATATLQTDAVLDSTQTHASSAGGTAAPAVGTPIAINRASVSELLALPGVGPVLAQRIVDFRAAHGAFRGPDDLRRVAGIGERTAARLAPHVRFE